MSLLLLVFLLTRNVNRQLSRVKLSNSWVVGMQESFCGFTCTWWNIIQHIYQTCSSWCLFLEVEIDIDLPEVWIVPLSNLCFKMDVWIIILRSVLEMCDFNHLLQGKLILLCLTYIFQRDINCAENELILENWVRV